MTRDNHTGGKPFPPQPESQGQDSWLELERLEELDYAERQSQLDAEWAAVWAAVDEPQRSGMEYVMDEHAPGLCDCGRCQ